MMRQRILLPIQRSTASLLSLVIGAAILMPQLKATQPIIVNPFAYGYYVTTNSVGMTWNLATNFNAPSAPSNMVVMNSSLGNFTIQLFPLNAPKTVANFLNYVNTGAYQNTIIHRSVPGFIIQGGGFTANTSLSSIPTFPAIPSEFGLPNTIGTIAMALVGTDSNSATDQWFINLANNTSILDATNTAGNPPFTVFGQVIGNGMSVVDAIAALPLGNLGGAFGTIPLENWTNTSTVSINNLVIITNVLTLPYFAVSSDPSAFAVKLNGSNLTVSFVTYPTNSTTLQNLARISVYATDTNGLSTNASFAVVPSATGSQTISFSQISPQSYTTNAFIITNYPTSSSGVSVLVSRGSGPIVASNNVLYFTGIGTASLVANTQTNANINYYYKPATPVTNTFVIAPSPEPILLPPLTNETYGGPPIALSSTNFLGAPISYSVLSGSAVISNNTLILTGAGTVTLRASTASTDSNYVSSSVTNTFSVAKAAQSISFPGIANRSFNTNPFSITPPTASSHLPVVLALSPTNLATFTSNSIAMKGVGTVTLTATQLGNSNYLAATPFTDSFVIGKGSQTISFTQPATQTFSTNGSFALSATAPGGAVTFACGNTNVISISGTTATIKGAGIAVITANQIGNTLYTAATTTNTVTVNKANQIISAFANIPTQTYKAGATVTITPPASSSRFPATVTVKSGPATISGSKITLTGKGTVVLAANIAATGNYNAAATVTTSFLVQ